MFTQTALLFIASIAIGVTYIVNKRLALSKYHPFSYVFLTSSISFIIAIPLLFYKTQISNSLNFWLLAIISALTFGISSLFSFKAYKISDASTVSLIHKLNIVIAALIGTLFLSEKYNIIASFGLLLIFLSSFVIVYEGKKIQIDKGVFYAFVMAVTSALAAVFDKVVLREFSPFTYVFINNFLIAGMFSVRKDAFKESLRILKSHTSLALFSSLLSVGSWAIFLFVLQSTNVSKTFPIYKSLSLIVPVLLGVLLLGEKQKLKQKIIGMILGSVGIILLSLAK